VAGPPHGPPGGGPLPQHCLGDRGRGTLCWRRGARDDHRADDDLNGQVGDRGGGDPQRKAKPVRAYGVGDAGTRSAGGRGRPWGRVRWAMYPPGTVVPLGQPGSSRQEEGGNKASCVDHRDHLLGLSGLGWQGVYGNQYLWAA
jgi:hypothetical protein